MWALIDYTLEFSRGARPRDAERAAFRKGGKLCWTTGKGQDLPRTAHALSASRIFFYVQVETEELLYFVLVNSLFSLMLETEPSNHWHSILIPKAYLK